MDKITKNALLAGLWAALATLAASQSFSKAALLAALAVGGRVAAGRLQARRGKRFKVDV